MEFFTAYLILSLWLSLFYGYLIACALRVWKTLPIWTPPPDFHPDVTISVIIPARNEADNIFQCLRALAAQSYPAHLFEVIVVNDHSTDNTAEIVQRWQQQRPQIQLLHLADFLPNQPINSYKKKALEMAIARAQGELIITTDADCIAPRHWIWLLAAFYRTTGAKCIAAPVNFHQERNLLERFQSLDYAGTMILTAAGIHTRAMRLGNGANLAYLRSVFTEVNGFEGTEHLASGDDMLLMQKIATRYPAGIHFLKNATATVLTYPKPGVRSFLQQRLRWATKSTSYRDWKITFTLAMVFLLCGNIVLSGLLIPVAGAPVIGAFVVQLAVKITFDYKLLTTACRFFGRTDLLRSFLPAQALHIAYILIIGLAGNLVKRYEWKGRRVQ